MKTIIGYMPFEESNPDTHWDRGSWPCRWISHPDATQPPFVTAYKREFILKERAVVRRGVPRSGGILKRMIWISPLATIASWPASGRWGSWLPPRR